MDVTQIETFDQKVRDKAYQLWEKAGCVHGSDQEYWYRAVHFVTYSTDGFDEEWYLSKYGDIARALSDGRLKSGYAHYVGRGRAEGRLPLPPTKS
jgi:hypothetical protein